MVLWLCKKSHRVLLLTHLCHHIGQFCVVPLYVSAVSCEATGWMFFEIIKLNFYSD